MPLDYPTEKVADMPWLGALLLLLIVSPLIMFVAHAIAFRTLNRAGVGATAHSSAFIALLVAFLPVCGMAWRFGVFDTSQDVTASLCAFAYMAVVYGALAVLYLDVVNIAETSLHMHLLLELAWNRATPIADLLERYSADRMIAARLERLTSLGQVRIADGRCYVGNRSTLYLAGAIDAWRVVLGLPTTPPDASGASVAVGHSGQ
jgi:hypothetical protein